MRWTSIPSRGSSDTPSHFMQQKLGYKLQKYYTSTNCKLSVGVANGKLETSVFLCETETLWIFRLQDRDRDSKTALWKKRDSETYRAAQKRDCETREIWLKFCETHLFFKTLSVLSIKLETNQLCMWWYSLLNLGEQEFKFKCGTECALLYLHNPEFAHPNKVCREEPWSSAIPCQSLNQLIMTRTKTVFIMKTNRQPRNVPLNNYPAWKA